MARRRKDGGSAAFVLVGLFLAALAMAGPFVVAGWAIIAELRARKAGGAGRAIDVVTPTERTALERLQAEISSLDLRIEDAIAHGEARGWARRSDGWFDGRNPQARDLNTRLGGLQAQRSEAENRLEALKDQLGAHMESWLSARAGVVGARTGLLLFIGVFAGLTLSRLAGQGEEGLSTLLFGTGRDAAERIVASGIATLAAAVGIWAGGASARASLSA